jgi:regulator of sigma E protease
MNWYILTIIPILGLLVFVHEFGHFITAKWAGIRVEEFGMGFPPTLVSIRKRERGGWEVMWFGRSREIDTSSTLNPLYGTSGGPSRNRADASDRTMYSLNLLPIGGFVRLSGEMGDAYDENGIYDPKSFAAKSAGKRLIVLVAGVVMNFLLAIVLFTVAYTGGQPVGNSPEPIIGSLESGSPAQLAGLQVGDRVLSVNGVPIHSFDQMRKVISQAAAQYHGGHDTIPITLVVRHEGLSSDTTVLVHARAHPKPDEGYLGVNPKVIFVTTPIWQAPFKGIALTFDTIRLLVVTLVQMIVGILPFHVAGPVGIARITGTVAQSISYAGWWPLLALTAMLSLNLAIFNILPFPALDGGRVFLILVEVLRGGKRLRPERESLINFVGMAILLLLMLVVTVSDVLHWGS